MVQSLISGTSSSSVLENFLFSTNPNVPSGWCSQIKITDRTKFGSFKNGFAISSVPGAGDIINFRLIRIHFTVRCLKLFFKKMIDIMELVKISFNCPNAFLIIVFSITRCQHYSKSQYRTKIFTHTYTFNISHSYFKNRSFSV